MDRSRSSRINVIDYKRLERALHETGTHLFATRSEIATLAGRVGPQASRSVPGRGAGCAGKPALSFPLPSLSHSRRLAPAGARPRRSSDPRLAPRPARRAAYSTPPRRAGPDLPAAGACLFRRAGSVVLKQDPRARTFKSHRFYSENAKRGNFSNNRSACRSDNQDISKLQRFVVARVAGKSAKSRTSFTSVRRKHSSFGAF